MRSSRKKKVSLEDLDQLFNSGSDKIDEYFDYEKARRPNLALKRVNLDFSPWVVNAMDKEAARIGVARIAVLKMWTSEKAKAIGE
ncbi:MAG: CopG family transcriptional regulator [Nitrospirota bacterium]